MRLLLAEDEKALSSALQVILKHNNYSVDAVYNGQDTYDYIMAGVYDGVILDVMMPKMDGFTVLSKIRAEGAMFRSLCSRPRLRLMTRSTALIWGRTIILQSHLRQRNSWQGYAR